MRSLRTGERLLLQALSRAIRGERLTLEEHLAAADWEDLRKLTVQHRLLPLLAEALYPGSALSEIPGEWARLSDAARKRTIAQAARTAEFLDLMDELAARGLEPVVMKGVVCRCLYPQPEQRVSSDEDLLIPREELPAYHTALLACGLRLLDPHMDLDAAEEITYTDPDRDLCLELHVKPFPGSDTMWGDINACFENVSGRSVSVEIYRRHLRTMEPTDHLLYLLCHAYKHLIYSGVGIRQICDLCLLGQRCVTEIDWISLRRNCEELGIETLAAAMFQIGQRWLEIPAPAAFSDLKPDEMPLLEDCLSGGLYGAEDLDRVHSRAFTLDSIRAEREGRQAHGTVRALFPSSNSLAGRYPYLRKRPWLLPAAWVQRACRYLIREKADPGKSVRIGRERVALLRQYGLLH